MTIVVRGKVATACCESVIQRLYININMNFKCNLSCLLFSLGQLFRISAMDTNPEL